MAVPRIYLVLVFADLYSTRCWQFIHLFAIYGTPACELAGYVLKIIDSRFCFGAKNNKILIFFVRMEYYFCIEIETETCVLSFHLCGLRFQFYLDSSWHLDWVFMPWMCGFFFPPWNIICLGFLPPTSKTEHNFIVFSSHVSRPTVLWVLLRNPGFTRFEALHGWLDKKD